jgi:3-oxoacyl-[acyl-carrier protein] reductase
MSLRHQGRVVLVSGAGSGIGAAIALRYCEEGAAVGIVDADAQRANEQAERLGAAGFRVAWEQADVADHSQCAAACSALEKALGPIDTLINNAGISPKHNGQPAAIWQMSPEEWNRVVGVNLNGAFNLSSLLARGMVERGFGRIVSLSSVAGSAFLPLVAAHYSATKAALIGFTRHLAGELGPHGITANALAPGRIETPLLKTVSAQANQAVVDVTPLRRLGQVLDVAGGWLMR